MIIKIIIKIIIINMCDQGYLNH